MKTTFKKTLALVLCSIMAFSCLTLFGSAETAEPASTFKVSAEGGYLAIGDSIGKGAGCSGSYIKENGEIITDVADCGGQYNTWERRYVEGSYPAQVADAVGCTDPQAPLYDDTTSNFYPCTFGGMTTAVANDLYGFEDNYCDTGLGYYYYDEVLRYFGCEQSEKGARLQLLENENYILDERERNSIIHEVYDAGTETKTRNSVDVVEPKCGKAGNIRTITENVDLITVELGMCDIFYRAYRIVTDGKLLADLSLDTLTPETIKNVLTKAVDLLNEGYNNWQTQYTTLLNGILELNPDVTLVMVGSFNMVDQMTIIDQLSFPLGSIFSSYTDKMNKQYQEWEKEYSENFNVIYCDISNTEALCTQEDWSVLGTYDTVEGELVGGFMNASFAGSHPSIEGHNYIARQILSVLPTQIEKPDTGNDIIADLVRYNDSNVTKVYVNGIPVDYSFNGYTITIPYKTALATTMVLKTEVDDDIAGFQFYTLSHNKDGGYIVSRQFGHNSTADLFGRPIALIQFLFDLIKSLIG